MSADVKGGVMREVVARVVDPEVWLALDSYRQHCDAKVPGHTIPVAAFTDSPSLAKADTILALLPTVELLEALKGLLPAVEAYLMSGDVMTRAAKEGVWRPEIAAARASIRKAEGPSS